MHSIFVELNEHRYPIFVGAELFNKPQMLADAVKGHQVMIVTNSVVAPLYLEKVKKSLSHLQCDQIILPDGEQYKTLATAEIIFNELIAKKHTRSTTLISLGGGVVGDLTGFAAACYMRGVAFIQIPTTLLAQVDAAIGGKTAVNHPLGKNMIGFFHQPKAVIIDINTLSTLQEREYCAGLAEVVKYGLIRDAGFFDRLEKDWDSLLKKDKVALEYAILRSCEIKAKIVAEDEHEKNVRALLNLGHSFAHAIESGLGYGTWLHGEAVAVGMLIAVDLSIQQGWLQASALSRLKILLQKAHLPVQLPKELSPENILALMMGDKKNIHGKIRLILVKEIGSAIVTDEVTSEKIMQTLKSYY